MDHLDLHHRSLPNATDPSESSESIPRKLDGNQHGLEPSLSDGEPRSLRPPTSIPASVAGAAARYSQASTKPSPPAIGCGGARREGLSVCMIVRNERENLPRCLDSLRDLADELIIVDTGSTDGTPDVAAQYGARVLSFPWRDDFAAARNHALAAAECSTILWLDADEVLPFESLEEVSALVRASETASPAAKGTAHWVTIEDLHDDDTGRRLTHQLRMVPNRVGVHFEGAVHEEIQPSLIRLGIPSLPAHSIHLLHDGHRDPRALRRKRERNRRILESLDRQGLGGPRERCLLAHALTGLNTDRSRARALLVRSVDEPTGLSPELWSQAALQVAQTLPPERSEPLVQSVRARVPANALAAFMASTHHRRRGEHEAETAALRDCVAVIISDDSPLRSASVRADAHLRLAELAIARGETEIAGGHLRSATHAVPRRASAWVSRIRLALDHHGLATAEAIAVRAASQVIELAPILAIRGEIQLRAGRNEEAVQNFEQAVALAPDSARSRANLGRGLVLLGRAEDAIPHLETALNLEAGRLELYGLLGDALLNVGRPADAIVAFERYSRSQAGPCKITVEKIAQARRALETPRAAPSDSLAGPLCSQMADREVGSSGGPSPPMKR